MAKDNIKNLLDEDGLGEDIIKFFKEILENFHLPIDLKFLFQSNSRQKKLIKITKIADPYSVALNKDILVTFNEDYYDKFDDDIKMILIEQEIDKIEINTEKGTFKIGHPTFSSNLGIIEKWTYNQVERAIETEKLYEKQKKEQEQEEGE